MHSIQKLPQDKQNNLSQKLEWDLPKCLNFWNMPREIVDIPLQDQKIIYLKNLTLGKLYILDLARENVSNIPSAE